MGQFLYDFVSHFYLLSCFYGLKQFVMIFDHAPYHTASVPNTPPGWPVINTANPVANPIPLQIDPNVLTTEEYRLHTALLGAPLPAEAAEAPLQKTTTSWTTRLSILKCSTTSMQTITLMIKSSTADANL